MKHSEELSMGQRAADGVRNGMGSWLFVLVALVFLGVWMTTNGFTHDVFPWILLNLLLSCLAALQGSILLIASKRQDEIAQALAQHDFEVNLEAEERIEKLQQHLHDIEDQKLDKIMVSVRAMQSCVTRIENMLVKQEQEKIKKVTAKKENAGHTTVSKKRKEAR